ncbi:response regulator [Prosthecochloris sp. GSB1]|uniref:response regulator n=1 Tax=Prosthecochloris sp. GSB1 TaxID=281093 RepID=UPI000B8CC276|nr:response regulator [Prosthecochloris sp. GSB1]ASQ89778.1 response regulator [Prosthecochloris sp. GSB1]
MKVLIIDDDKAIRGFIEELLRNEGYMVVSADNGKSALTQFEKHSDILTVISDIIMPEQEGVETIRHIKKTRPDIRVVAISGGGKIGPENYLQLAHAIGADVTLKKPFTRQELLDTLKAL